MSKNLAKDTMVYYNIEALEDILQKDNIATTLWSMSNSSLHEKIKPLVDVNDEKVISFYKDKSDSTNVEGATLYRGLFVVLSDKELSSINVALLFSNYIKEHPSLDRNIPEYAYSGISSKSIAAKKDVTSGKLVVNKLKDDHIEDLNETARSMKSSNIVFGVIDDISHIDVISRIPGVEIIHNVGDFRKTYFSIPSDRRAEVLAHSVSILPYIKCRRALEDFVAQ